MKASDYIAAYLHARGVTHVFELVGGMITHLLDSIARRGDVRIVSVHHEQAASFAAEGFGRMAGVPGVAMATSGPGATNLLTGIGSCYFDSTPTVFITGQVNRAEQKGGRAIRQLGFQETDIVAMAAPVTKMAVMVRDPGELPAVLERAFRLATKGRPGPVLVDIPMDVQRAEIDAAVPQALAGEAPARLPLGQSAEEPRWFVDRAAAPGRPLRLARKGQPVPSGSRQAEAGAGDLDSGPAIGMDPGFLGEMIDRLASASRPLILAGGGVRSARAVAEFRRFVEAAGVPVVHSLMGVDLLPAGHPLRVGMIGSYGNRWANLAIDRSDVLLVLGSRLDVRQTGSQTEAFKGGRAIFHVDCEPGELNNRVTGCRALVSELRPLLRDAADAAGPLAGVDRSAWLAEIGEARRAWPDVAELRDVPGINPNGFMHALSARSGAASAFVADVGQHQMWAAQSLDLGPDQRFLTSGGMGAMGFALPAALGAAFAAPGRPVVVVAGDGGFQLNLQELQTVARNRLPIKMVVINNRCHGMVRQFQQSYFERRYQSTYDGYSAPDFAAVARAYGIAAATVADPAAVGAALDALWADPAAPFLLDVHIDTFANAYPKLAFGLPISQMEPLARPLDMEGT